MISRKNSITTDRTGTVAALFAFLLLPLLALLALFVDYGYLLYVRTDMQRAADQAALAGVQELAPDADGSQDFEAAKASIREFVKLNLGSGFLVDDGDIEIGRYEPSTIYSSLTLLNDGIADTVRVTIRRESGQNGSVALYFARLFDSNSKDLKVTSAAVLQKAQLLLPGTGVFPFAVPDEEWAAISVGGEFNLYGDGKIDDGAGNPIPGNWGTVDIGPKNNSTNDLRNQIVDGLSQNDLNALHSQGAIPTNTHIDATQTPLVLNADPGFSAGIKHGVEEVHGVTKIAPIFDQSTLGGGSGNNLNYDIIGWGVVEVVDSYWQGSNNSYINVKKAYTYDGNLAPNPDLSNTSGNIDGAFTSPVLVQ